MANRHIDGVTFVSELIYKIYHDFNNGPFEKKLIVSNYSHGVFKVYAHKQTSSILGNHLIFIITNENKNCSKYKVNISVKIQDPSVFVIDTLTDSRSTSKPMKFGSGNYIYDISLNFEFEKVEPSLNDDMKILLNKEPNVNFITSDGQVSVSKFPKCFF